MNKLMILLGMTVLYNTIYTMDNSMDHIEGYYENTKESGRTNNELSKRTNRLLNNLSNKETMFGSLSKKEESQKRSASKSLLKIKEASRKEQKEYEEAVQSSISLLEFSPVKTIPEEWEERKVKKKKKNESFADKNKAFFAKNEKYVKNIFPLCFDDIQEGKLLESIMEKDRFNFKDVHTLLDSCIKTFNLCQRLSNGMVFIYKYVENNICEHSGVNFEDLLGYIRAAELKENIKKAKRIVNYLQKIGETEIELNALLFFLLQSEKYYNNIKRLAKTNYEFERLKVVEFLKGIDENILVKLIDLFEKEFDKPNDFSKCVKVFLVYFDFKVLCEKKIAILDSIVKGYIDNFEPSINKGAQISHKEFFRLALQLIVLAALEEKDLKGTLLHKINVVEYPYYQIYHLEDVYEEGTVVKNYGNFFCINKNNKEKIEKREKFIEDELMHYINKGRQNYLYNNFDREGYFFDYCPAPFFESHPLLTGLKILIHNEEKSKLTIEECSAFLQMLSIRR